MGGIMNNLDKFNFVDLLQYTEIHRRGRPTCLPLLAVFSHDGTERPIQRPKKDQKTYSS